MWDGKRVFRRGLAVGIALAVCVSVNACDVLPTLALPNGDGRGVSSVWGWTLK